MYKWFLECDRINKHVLGWGGIFLRGWDLILVIKKVKKSEIMVGGAYFLSLEGFRCDFKEGVW